MVKTNLLILVAVLLAAVPVFADSSTPPATLMRVDQAVGDLDKLSVSLRKIEPGLHTPTQLPALFVPVVRATDPVSYTSPIAGPVPYYRMGPGYRARVDRLDYLIVINPKKHDIATNITPVQDGHYFELAPANMVYELSPCFPSITTIDRQALVNRNARTPEPGAQIDHRLPSSRLETRIERRIEPPQVDKRVDPQR